MMHGHPAETVSDPLTRAVIISLFTWRRAEPDDDTDIPMGWWGDTWPTVADDRIGSRLYLLRRSRLTAQTAHKARDHIAHPVDEGGWDSRSHRYCGHSFRSRYAHRDADPHRASRACVIQLHVIQVVCLRYRNDQGV